MLKVTTLNKSIMRRLVITAKDIQIITGRSERYGRSIITKMKKHYNKEEYQFISIDESCEFMGLKKEDVYLALHIKI